MDHTKVHLDVDSSAGQRRGVRHGIVVLSAVVSLALVFWAGRHNGSALLVLLFTLWVASPFAALLLVDRASTGLPVTSGRAVGRLAPLVSMVSALIYIIEVFLVHPAKAAAPFLVVPAVSWAAILLSLWIGRRAQAG